MPARSAFGTAGVDRLVVPRQLRLVGTASRPTSWSTRRRTHGSTRPSLRRTQRTGRMPAAPQRLPAHSHPWRPADPDLDRLCLFRPCGGAHTRSTTALGPSRGRAHDARRRAGPCGSFCRSFLRRPDCMVYRVTGANSAGTAVPRHIPVHGIPGLPGSASPARSSRSWARIPDGACDHNCAPTSGAPPSVFRPVDEELAERGALAHTALARLAEARVCALGDGTDRLAQCGLVCRHRLLRARLPRPPTGPGLPLENLLGGGGSGALLRKRSRK